MKNKLPKTMICFFIIIWFYATTFGVSSFKFIISPPIVNLKVHPNKSYTINLTVDNRNDQKLPLVLKACDLAMDTNGNALVAEKTGNPFSCAGWLNFAEKSFVMEANSKKVIPVTIKVPPGASGGNYGIVLFQTAAQSAVDGELLLIGQMGTILMIETYGLKKIQGTIREFRFRKENGRIHFIINIENQGNTHFQVKGSMVIKDERDKIVDRVNLATGTGTILPGHAREFRGTWKNQQKMRTGNYQAILQVHIPGLGGMLQEIIDLTI